jgi:hypothetical protein
MYDVKLRNGRQGWIADDDIHARSPKGAGGLQLLGLVAPLVRPRFAVGDDADSHYDYRNRGL